MQRDPKLVYPTQGQPKVAEPGVPTAAESWQRHQEIANLVRQIRAARRPRTTDEPTRPS